MDKVGMERQQAVERFRKGESVTEICASLGRSLRWLYKWIERAEAEGEWWLERSRARHGRGNRSSEEIEQLVVHTRQRLARENGFQGAQSIAWELDEATMAHPSIATINRILKRYGLIEHTPARRPSKGRKYPTPLASHAGSVHQSDFVGPRYLRGPVRFYSFNTVDVSTGRCATVPLRSRSDGAVVPALWESWVRLGIPQLQQFDNELVFFGSRLHPRGLSQVLRLCLMHGVEPLFIPPAEPWRNGVVEKFNDHWQQKVLGQPMTTFEELHSRSLAFDARHNSRWRYRKNDGRTPNQVLAASQRVSRVPTQLAPSPSRLPRPERGRYHFIRFIRSDQQLDIFGERFLLPPEAAHEYVQATVDVAEQHLQVRLDGRLIQTFEYRSK
jgi:putative transposase